MRTGLRTTFFTTLLLVLGLVNFAFGVNVGFASASSSGDESATSVNITVNLASDPGAVSYVQYSVTGGTATGSGTDYTLSNGTLTFPLNDTSEDITLTVVDDALDENNETVIITLSSPAGGADGLGTSEHTYTITDNDATPSIQFTSSSSSGSESVNPANMELTLSAASGLTVTVSYTVGAGTATSGGTDFSLASGTATISAGQTTTNISATINDDVLDENNETINVTISGPSNATLGTNTSFTYTITDDDASPDIQVTSTSASGSEAVSPVTIQLIISAISGRDVSVNYSLSGTASGSGTDYTLASGTATVTAGNNTVDLSATINNDALDENNETLILTISDPTDCTLGTNTTHTYTITDNDATPTVQFTSTTAQGAESITPVTMQLQLSAASGLDVSVNYAISGTATGSGTDYTMAAGSATITAGNTTTDLSATIIDDALDENDETLIVTISNPTNATLGGNTTHTYTLQDNDATPSIEATLASSSGPEGTTPANIEVTLSAASGLNATVDYAVSGTATGSGTDYTLANGTATITAGGTTTNISPTINDDALDEAGETIILTLSNPSNASLGTNTTHTFTINDNDDPPTIQFSAASSNGDEGTSPATLTLQLPTASSLNVTVDYAVSGTATGGGTDYTLAAGTATITAGQTTTTVSATINDDALDEDDETIIVTISNPGNATLGTNNIHTYSITDNDPLTSIQFSSTTSTGTEGTASVNFELAIAATAGRDITVDYAVSGTATGTGTDYTLADGTATITAGSTTTNVTATVVDDGLDENDETIILTISNPSNATLGTNTTHTYTLTDNDNPPTVQFTATTSNGGEATTPANLEVSLSTASGLDITVDYTASGGTATGSGTDYTLANGTLTISAGSTTGNISPTINDDALDENNETIIVTISNPTNSSLGTNTTHTYTITDDDDPPTVAFSTTSASANENSTPATFTISLSSASGLDVTVDYALSGTASGSNVDYSLPAGTATISAGGTSTTLSATITDDEVVEDDETIIVTLSNPTNSSLGANTTHTYTITNDDTGPAAFTVGAVTTTGGTIVAGYWNATNTGLDVVVPVENNSDLVGGTIQLQAKKGVLSFENVGNSYTIASGDLGSNKTMSLTAVQFEGVTGFGEDAEMTLTAVITDQNTNSTTGTASSTTITVDQLTPTQLTIGTVSATGGNATAGYWNSSNTDMEVVVPLTSSDASLANGTVQLQAEADGTFEDLGAASTISGAELSAGTKTVEIDSGGTASTDVEELTGFGDGDVLEVKAVVTDIAGNSTTFLVSSSTLTVDQTVPTITDVNSSTTDGYYKLGDQISIQINSTKSVTVTGTPQLTLETGTTDAVVDYSSGSPGTSLTFTYSVGTGEESSDLNYGSTGDLALNGSSIRDAAGNDLNLVLPSLAGPNSLGDNKNLVVDGISPSDFTVGAVTTVGGSVVSGYWNSTNTSIKVVVPLDVSDSSLSGGTIQLQAEADGTYEDLGSSSTIVADSVTGGQQTITIQATGTASTDFEELTGFSEGDEITIRASIGDIAGNGTQGTASSSTLLIDQTVPAAFTVGTVLPVGGNVNSGYWNSTNSGISVVVPVQSSDASLSGGTVRLQAKVSVGGTYQSIANLPTIESADVTSGSKTVTADSAGTDSVDVEELTGFADTKPVYVKAILTDIAGNSTTGTESSSILTIDQTVPTITDVTSSDLDGYYELNDSITVQVTASEAITVTGTPKLTLETGTTDGVASYSAGSGSTTLSFGYTVGTGEASSDLNYQSTAALSLNGGTLRDGAGNDLGLTLPTSTGSSSLAGNKDIIVDGSVPSDFTVSAVTILGGTVVAGYWNSTNTLMKVVVPLETSDASLSGGTIQVQGEADGTFEDLGLSVTIGSDSLSGGSHTVTIQPTGTDSTDLEELTGFGDGDEITIRAVITDVAGNSTTGTASSTTFTVDQTTPSAFIVGAVLPTGGNIYSGYWNSTNSGISVVVPVESSDASLVGGSLRLQAKAGVAASFENIANLVTIENADVTIGSRTVSADSAGTDSVDIEELSGFEDVKPIYITAILTDIAGNSTTGTQSDSTLIIDQTIPQLINVLSYITNGSYTVDDTIQIEIAASENVYLSGTPQLTLETGSIDAVTNYSSGSGTDTLSFVYIVDDNQSSDDLDYTSSASFALSGATIRDIAGNDLETTLPTPGQSGSLGANKIIIIDTAVPSVEFQYANLTQTNLIDTGNEDDLVEITATYSEQIDNSPSPTLNVEFADSTNDSFIGLSPQGSSNNDSVWVYQFSLPDSSINDGIMAVTINASDLAGNLVATLIDSQKFEIDNTPPLDFSTGSVTPTGTNVVSGWINGSIDSIEVVVPIDATDESLLLGGKVDIQVSIPLKMGSSWITVGQADSIAQRGTGITFSRAVNDIVTVLTPQGLAQGDTILTRAKVWDRVTNGTNGTASSDTLIYDPNRPVLSAVVGGIVFDQDTVVSNDTISVIWNSFTDPVPATASGINYYEWAIEEVGSGTINGFKDWTNVGLDTSDSVVLPLVHNTGYRVHIKAYDNAGNPSDTLSYNPPDSLLRLNSPPVFAAIDSQSVDEDVLFTYQATATDVDLTTLLGDTLHYTILDTGITGTANRMSINELTGLLTWNTPLQADSGRYTVVLWVTDEWQIPGGTTNYADTVSFVLTVNSVNDTPQILAAFPDTLIFDEDESSTQRLNLTQYVDDVDNNDTTQITWSALIMSDTVTYPSYPLLIIGPGATPQVENAIRNFILGDFGKTRGLKGTGSSGRGADSGFTVQISASADSATATFVADSNYYVINREVIFIATDSDGASDSTSLYVTITALNDPPVITAISDTTVLENDTLQLVLRATDLDNSVITFQVFPDSSQIQVEIDDSIATFIPQALWSYQSNILVVVSDDSSSDSTSFLLDIIRVKRPHLALSLGQNATFSRYFEFMVTDTMEKALDVDLTINPLGVSVSLEQLSNSGPGAFTWVGNYEFDTTGTFSLVMDATALVGDTTITRSSQMSLAKAKSGWTASSSDGIFRIIAGTGAVPFDQPLMIVDSLLFPVNELDGGLYRIGHPMLTFDKPVMVLIPSSPATPDKDQAIYLKGRDGKWKEIPTISKKSELIAWTSEMGYFKIGKRTILVPEKTTLGNNYPNPFNAQTRIVFDIGFFGGPDQKISVIVYNLLGQDVKTLHNGRMAIGHHELTWHGLDNSNVPVSSGVYFVRLLTDKGISQTKKMMILR